MSDWDDMPGLESSDSDDMPADPEQHGHPRRPYVLGGQHLQHALEMFGAQHELSYGLPRYDRDRQVDAAHVQALSRMLRALEVQEEKTPEEKTPEATSSSTYFPPTETCHFVIALGELVTSLTPPQPCDSASAVTDEEKIDDSAQRFHPITKIDKSFTQ